MRNPFKRLTTQPLKLWQLVLPLLGLAIISSLLPALPWAAVTLGVFLTVPGYLLLQNFNHGITSRLTVASLSVTLSLLVLMVSGLTLNSLHALGLDRPLETLPVLATLSTVNLALLARIRNLHISLPHTKLSSWRPSLERSLAVLGVSLLPLLAIGGAIRLNNGGSNILTMILFALVPVVLGILLLRPKLRGMYPYALFMIGLSLLFATSLRGSFIAGHDIQHEFLVFQRTIEQAYWSSTTTFGDPYNACLSITILPTLFAKLTAISDPYIFKIAFQAIFAASIMPIYLLIRQWRGARYALLGSFVFMLFPTFLSDMPFLNRQEIAFAFFGGLMLVTFTTIANRAKTVLTMLLLLGLILSHYSSSYVTIGMLVLACVAFKLLTRKRTDLNSFALPVLSLPLLAAAFVFTFFWNAQITDSTGGLQKTIANTFSSLVNGNEQREGFVSYGLLAPAPASPEEKLRNRANAGDTDVTYVAPETLPVSSVGQAVSNVVDVEKFNTAMHSFVAKAFQLLLIIGLLVLFIKQRLSTDQRDLYHLAIGGSALAVLALITVMPQLSVDYSVIRLFQQTLVITALPVIIGAAWLFGWLRHFKMIAVTLLFVVMFGHLSGFTPQILGGFRPQLSLNNAGAYYDFFYTHQSDIHATSWLAANRDHDQRVYMDTFASAPPRPYTLYTGLLQDENRENNQTGYVYLDAMNSNRGTYRVFLSGDLVEYRDPQPTSDRDLIYSNDSGQIYDKR